ncbi:nose resistant to fluoxetine protein 6-like isoform X3 [Biomphalaria glabrata]|uniref:Nose resistant to fluoxetine protein 6-like isoform X3 n=1 Tax=Biomphalaria glabrata TaxID=6526 RepID=A0A9W3BFU8_BIOGL|nr:nose resistant to fluoxetine protein 6-like isoform X3 [Biomphalaria glabrata]
MFKYEINTCFLVFMTNVVLCQIVRSPSEDYRIELPQDTTNYYQHYQEFQRLVPQVLYQSDLLDYISSASRPGVGNQQNVKKLRDMNKLYTPNTSLNEDLENIANNAGRLGAAADSTTITPYLNEKCLAHTNQLISAFRKSEYWALSVIDSWGKPGPSLLEGRFNLVGNYRQCRAAQGMAINNTMDGFKGNYCVLQIKMKNTMAKETPVYLQSQFVQLGACCPASCSQGEISVLLREGFRLLNLSTIVTIDTECHTDDRVITKATIASIILASFIGVAIILGSMYDLLHTKHFVGSQVKPTSNILPGVEDETLTQGNFKGENIICAKRLKPLLQETKINEAKMNPSDIERTETEHLINSASKHKEEVPEPNIFSQMLLAFSLFTNGSKLLSTSQSPDTLSVISGVRFLSMTWVILGHTYTYGFEKFANAMTEFPYLLRRWSTDAISNSFVSVDTFFAIRLYIYSGLLVSYLTLKEMSIKGWRLKWGLYYFHRFWRLTPSYMLVLLFVLGFQRFLGSGALWDTVQPNDQVACEKNWWTNLLYINNIVNRYEKCFGHSWYLANDMQFFLLSPLMLIPLHCNIIFGLSICSFFLIGQWICVAVLSVHYRWPTVLVGLNKHIQESSDHWMKNYYIVPWCRIGPYVIGILTGYFLVRSDRRISLNKGLAMLGWTTAAGTALLVLYGLHGDTGGDHPSSVGVAALYNAVARSAWGACVCWVVVACVSGYGGPVNKLLSWSPFIPLGRLTYMAYLIHPCLIKVYYGNHEVPFYLSDINLVVTYLGILVMTYMISFVLNLALESPMIGLEKILLRKK